MHGIALLEKGRPAEGNNIGTASDSKRAWGVVVTVFYRGHELRQDPYFQSDLYPKQQSTPKSPL